MDAELSDDDWSIFEAHIETLVKKHRLAAVRDSLNQRLASVDQPGLKDRVLADYDNGLGMVLFNGGYYREALPCFERAADVCSLYDNPDGYRANLVNRVLCLALLNDTAASLALFRRLIDSLIRAQTIRDEVHGDPSGFIRDFYGADRIQRLADSLIQTDPVLAAGWQYLLGYVFTQNDDTVAARRALEKAFILYQRNGDLSGLFYTELFLAENAAKTDPLSDTNDLRFLSLVLKMFRVDSTREAGEAMRAWFKSAGRFGELRFDSVALAAFDRAVANEPDRSALRGRLELEISVKPEFELEPASVIKLIRDYLAGPKMAGDTLRPIAAQWLLMEQFIKTDQPDSARACFQALWPVLRRRQETSSLKDLVAMVQGIDNPFSGLTPFEHSLAVLFDNALRAENDTLALPSLDSLKSAFREVWSAGIKPDMALACQFMAEVYRSSFANQRDSAEFYFWKEYALRRDDGDITGALERLEELAGLDGYDPFSYMAGLERDLTKIDQPRSAFLISCLADHFSRLAQEFYFNASSSLSSVVFGELDQQGSRAEQINYYQDLINYLTGGDQFLPDTTGRWTGLADAASINRLLVDTLTAYLADLSEYNDQQGTDQQVFNCLDELRAAVYLAWAGRLTNQALIKYRQSSQVLSGMLAHDDSLVNPVRQFEIFRDLVHCQLALRDFDSVITAYHLILRRLAHRLYRLIPRADREQALAYMVEAYRTRNAQTARLLKFELVAFADRRIVWGGGGFGAGAGEYYDLHEKKMMKPEAVYVEGKEIVRYLKPVTFTYLETRPPSWPSWRLQKLPPLISPLISLCQPDPGLVSRWRLLAGSIYLALDDLNSAASILSSVTGPEDDHWCAAATGLMRGILKRLTGDLASAEAELRRSQDQLAGFIRADLLRACLFAEAGNVGFTLGDLSAAETDYARARAIADEHPVFPLLNARLWLSSANVHLIQNLRTGDQACLDSAASYYRQALEWLGRNQELNTYLTINFNRSIIAWLRQDPDSARNLIRAVARDAAQEGLRLDQARAQTLTGYYDLQLGKYADALAVLDSAEAACRSTGDRLGLSNCLGLKGSAWRRCGQTARAYPVLKEAIDLHETISSGLIPNTDAAGEFYRLYQDQYAEMIQLLMEQARHDEARFYLERSRSYHLKEIFSAVRIETGEPGIDTAAARFQTLSGQCLQTEQQLVRTQSQSEQDRDSSAVQILSRTLARNRAQLEEILIDLEMANPDIYSLLTVKPQLLSEDRLRQALPSSAAVLEYFSTDTFLYIFVFRRDTTMVQQVKVNRREIDSLVLSFRSIVDECGQSVRAGFGVAPITDWHDPGVKDLIRILIDLDERLVQPVWEEIRHKEQLVIIPSGALYYLPFSALARSDNGRLTFLLEEKTVSYLSAATLMDILDQKKPAPVNLLAFGDPDGTLAAARAEVDNIGAVIAENKILTRQQATENRVKTLPSDYSILHLATHAWLDPVNPRASCIIFAPDSATGDDGRLEFGEILRLPLKTRTSLVTLSACQTGIGRNPTGGEVMSLARAFTAAGTPSILSTLWSVEDQATRQLMVIFYRGLREGDKASALRRAQLDLLADPRTAHPFFWAPFILIGERN